METLYAIASEMAKIPCSSSEKDKLDLKISDLSSDWDELCQQCVPAGVLPLVTTPTGVGGTLKFKPPSDFEDISQMLEWLILIESKLQPVTIAIGDLTRLKKTLRDLQRMEKELKLHEKDYKKFMDGMDPDVSNMSRSASESTMSSSAALNLSPSKTVKFKDENTLERCLRQKEITNQKFRIEGEGGSLESTLEDISESDFFSLVNGSSTPYHSAGPIAGQKSKLEPNLEQEKLGHILEPNSPDSCNHILSRMSSDPECSLSRVINHDSGPHSHSLLPLTEEHYHLMLFWKGIWTTLLQEKERLGVIKERWRDFESKKEMFSRFLFKAEERMAYFLRVIGGTKNLGVVQIEMMAQKVSM